MKKQRRKRRGVLKNRRWRRVFCQGGAMLLAILTLWMTVIPTGVTYAATISAGENYLEVKRANDKSGMWNLPRMDYLYSTVENARVRNYVKYIADDARNGWRLAYCTQFSNHFKESAEYISQVWQQNGMYSEISYAIEHGSHCYGGKNDAAYSTGDWVRDYYVTQAVIYCILSDYGMDGHPISSLRSVDGYQNVYDCTMRMYQDVKKNAGKDGYGDTPEYSIVSPASNELHLIEDGNWYQSDWYSVRSKGKILNGEVKLEQAPEGTELIWEESEGTKEHFYVRIPERNVRNLPTDGSGIHVTATASVERPYVTVFEAKAADHQNITFQQYNKECRVGSDTWLSVKPENTIVRVIKKDRETGQPVEGALYGVYSDSTCENLITEIPLTGKDGAAQIELVARQDVYYIKEIRASEGYLLDDMIKPVMVHAGETVEIEMEEQAVKGKIILKKIDRDTGTFQVQGDAILEGAKYGLYSEEDIVYPDSQELVLYPAGTMVAEGTINEAGMLAFENLYLGKYYIQEIAAPEGYLLDEKKYPVSLTYVDERTQIVMVEVKVQEAVKKQAFELIKISTDGSSAETELVSGAEFTVKLLSDIEKYGWEQTAVSDVIVTDEHGYGRSKELPFGKYLVRETKTPENRNTTDDFTVNISEDSKVPQKWRVFNDAPFSAYIRMVKKDLDTGRTVELAGTEFRIRDLDTGKDVSMEVGNKQISTFVTDQTGTITTPLKLKPGNYEAYEIKAPKGYLAGKEAVSFRVSSEEDYLTDEDGDFVIEVALSNKSQKGVVTVTKYGEKLDGIGTNGWRQSLRECLERKSVLTMFHYKELPLEGVVFQLICDEDIYTSDFQKDESGNRQLEQYHGVSLSKGTVIEEMITDTSGKASLTELPLGSYHLEEIQAAEGYVCNKKLDAFTLEYEGQNVEMSSYGSEFKNERQKVALRLSKTSSETGCALEGAVYGLYAEENIQNREGKVIIQADDLVESNKTDEDGKIYFQSDLPLGKYYIKEIEAAQGYLLDVEKYEVDASYQGQNIPVIEKEIHVQDVPIREQDHVSAPVTGDSGQISLFLIMVSAGVAGTMAGIYMAKNRKQGDRLC